MSFAIIANQNYFPHTSCLFNRKFNNEDRPVRHSTCTLYVPLLIKNAKIRLLPPFPSSKISKRLRTRPLFTGEAWGNSKMAYLTFYIWETLVRVYNEKFENLRDSKTQNHPKTRLRDLTFEIRQKFSETHVFRRTTLYPYIGRFYAQIRSKVDTPLHAQRYAPKNLVSRLPG